MIEPKQNPIQVAESEPKEEIDPKPMKSAQPLKSKWITQKPFLPNQHSTNNSLF